MLASLGRPASVLQLTYAPTETTSKVRAAVRELGLEYQAIPIAAPKDGRGAFLTGLMSARRHLESALNRRPPKTLIVRSVLPWIPLLPSTLHGPVLFDTDGLLPDERLEVGGPVSKAGYVLLRGLELEACRRSHVVLTRTKRAAELLRRRSRWLSSRPILKVPNGRDARVFYPSEPGEQDALRRELQLPTGRPIAVIMGSMGEQYLPSATRDLALRLARDLSAIPLVLAPDTARADQFFGDLPEVVIRSVSTTQVPSYLRASSLGIALRRASFSQQGVHPLKVGEFLLSGLPVVCSRAIGDLDEDLAHAEGVFLVSRDGTKLDEVVDWAREALSSNSFAGGCRRLGERHFSLSSSSSRYAEAIRIAEERARADG
ncbi:MAG: hypothetical protein AAF627_04460 [Myxococcota bacterium]